MKAVLRDVVDKGIRVVSNAGGVNPEGCAAALAALAKEQGIDLKIAVVTGDDVMPLLPALRESGKVKEMQSGEALPEKVLTANAYLGALPVKAALDAGALVVITGRCVDSAVTLGVLMHEFGWSSTDYDLLASGSLVGHILECGCQATGGLHTDWDTVPGWDIMGYPIAECRADGSFVLGKPAGTGGKITPAVIAEQMLYEIADPATYILPDVICDFTQVTMTHAGPQRVEVRGACGRAPTANYKVCATYVVGFKSSAQLTIVGFDAVAKARRTGAAIIDRTGAMLDKAKFGPYSATHIEVLGAESCYGPHGRSEGTREVVLRVTVTHLKKEALDIFAREIAPAGTSWAPGTTGASGRPSASPSIRQFSFLLGKSQLRPVLNIAGQSTLVEQPAGDENPAQPLRSIDGKVTQDQMATGGRSTIIEVPLIRLAYARSGDKGDISNIGVIARQPRFLPLLRAQVTDASVSSYLAHLVKGKVTRFEVPGIQAFNFVCEQALGGGGMASLRNDPLGKGMAQILLSMPVLVPVSLLAD